MKHRNTISAPDFSSSDHEREPERIRSGRTDDTDVVASEEIVGKMGTGGITTALVLHSEERCPEERCHSEFPQAESRVHPCSCVAHALGATYVKAT